ncbi:MAG: hypothetical protein AAFQ01_00610, partial [Bacteroidota bacterium]
MTLIKKTPIMQQLTPPPYIRLINVALMVCIGLAACHIDKQIDLTTSPTGRSAKASENTTLDKKREGSKTFESNLLTSKSSRATPSEDEQPVKVLLQPSISASTLDPPMTAVWVPVQYNNTEKETTVGRIAAILMINRATIHTIRDVISLTGDKIVSRGASKN